VGRILCETRARLTFERWRQQVARLTGGSGTIHSTVGMTAACRLDVSMYASIYASVYAPGI
jgi:hypothetical protein